jgi:hypothetical protein
MEVMLPLAGHSRICQEIKQKIKVWQDFWVVKLQLCSQNLSAASNSQFVRVIPYNFLHQVELIFVDWTNWFYLLWTKPIYFECKCIKVVNISAL